MKFNLTKISFLFGIFLLLYACNSTKRVKDGEFLLTENKVETGVDTISGSKLKPYISLKPNSKFLFGVPLKLYIANMAKPNADSAFINWLQKKPKREQRLTKFLSKKQLKKLGELYVGLNEGLIKNGETPSVLSREKLIKSQQTLKSWYWNKGWFNAEVDYEIKKDTTNKKAKVKYTITPNKAYTIDSISYNITSKDADSIYNSIKDKSFVKDKQQFDTENFTKERLRIENYFRNHGLYYFDRDYISFIADSLNENPQKLNVILNIKDREIKFLDTTYSSKFKVHSISEVNVFTDYSTQEKYISKDSAHYSNKIFFAKNKMKVSPKILSDAIFIEKGEVFSDKNRKDTYNRFSNMRVFEYPDI